MQKFLLRKISIVSLLLAIAFIIEFVFTKLFFGFECYASFLKIELLPIILIGLFFGFKFSFFSTLMYIFLHITLEYTISLHKHELFLDSDKENLTLFLALLFFVFILPYLSCSISGFFYRKDLKHFTKYSVILKILFFITIIQILSYALFTYLIFSTQVQVNEFLHDFSNNFFCVSFSLENSPYKMIFFYYLMSVLLNNSVIGFILYFINPVFKENLANLLIK